MDVAVSGTLDSSFSPGIGPNGSVYALAAQSDGKILVGGAFSKFNGADAEGIIRLLPNGSVDTNFQSSALVDNILKLVRTIAVQRDGKILIGGAFQTLHGSARNGLARLNADGGIDESFHAWNVPLDLSSIAIQGDGKILIGGTFQIASNNVSGLARLNPDGVLDATMQPHIVPSSTKYGPSYSTTAVTAIEVNANGRIAVAGNFEIFRLNEVSKSLLQYNPTGRLNSVFRPKLRFDCGDLLDRCVPIVETIVLFDDGSVLAGGYITHAGITPVGMLVRLLNDGTLDSAFSVETTTKDIIKKVLVQDDGKILVAGSFPSLNRTNHKNITRLNKDGKTDSTFNPGTGANGIVNTLALDQGGNIIIGGDFNEFDGRPAPRLARLIGSTNLSVRLFEPQFEQKRFSVKVLTAAGYNYLLEFNDSLDRSAWKALNRVSGNGRIQTLTDDLSSTLPQQRFYRVRIE